MSETNTGTRRWRTRWLVALTAIVVLATACGDDGSDTSPDDGQNTVESQDGPGETVPDDGVVEDAALARLQADAILRLVTIDHSFARDVFPFDTVVVSSQMATTPDRPLVPLALELVAADLRPDVAVTFTEVPDVEIADFAARSAGRVAVVRIDDIRIDGTRAELDASMWCGTTCGVFLTYAAELAGGTWNITGPTGPVAAA